MKTLHLEIAQADQEVIYKEVIDHEKRMLRVTIRSEAFQDKCFAKIEWFAIRAERWTEIAEIHFSYMKTPKNLYFKTASREPSVFAEDRISLINQAAAILNLAPV